MSETDEDARLMRRYAAGDLAAFGALYARHQGPLHRYLLRLTHDAGAASDLGQEVWSRLITMRTRYEARGRFATLLFHIAHNCAVDVRRRDVSARGALGHPGGLRAELPEHQRPDRLAEFGEQQDALLAAVTALPRAQRETFLLHEETGLSLEAIARVTDVPLETARSRLRYAVRKLKSAMLPAAAPRGVRAP